MPPPEASTKKMLQNEQIIMNKCHTGSDGNLSKFSHNAQHFPSKGPKSGDDGITMAPKVVTRQKQEQEPPERGQIEYPRRLLMENAARHNKLFALSAEAKSVLTLLISSVISFGSAGKG